MNHSPAVCLRLATDLTAMPDYHCSLCLFFNESSADCSHTPINRLPAKPSSTRSDHSFYTARTSDSAKSTISSISTSTGRAKSSRSSIAQKPSLKRKISPTEVSLRDLRARHAWQTSIRAQQSEEQLQRVYEHQIRAYLESTPPDLNSIIG